MSTDPTLRGSSPPPTGREGGYTIVEYVVVMSVFLLFMGMVTPFMFSQLRAVLTTERQVDIQQQARGALRIMVRELRQARELYSTAAKPTGRFEISFGVDFDGDGVVNSYIDPSKPLEQITYYLEDGVLYRGPQLGDGVPVAEDVFDVGFTLYGGNLALDVNGDGVVTPDEMNLNGDVYLSDDEEGDGLDPEEGANTCGNNKSGGGSKDTNKNPATKESKKDSAAPKTQDTDAGCQYPVWQAGELANVTWAEITMTLQEGAEQETFSATAWLRNRAVG